MFPIARVGDYVSEPVQERRDGELVHYDPLDVLWDGEGDLYYARGHHDPAAFLKRIVETYEPDNAEERLRDGEDVLHEWWRFVPDPYRRSWEGGYHPAKPHSRGAFPVTALYI